VNGPKKVLIVLHSELLGGATISVLRPLPLLEEMGWRFAFWVPSPGPAREWIEAHGYEAHGMPRPLASSLTAFRQPPGIWSRARATPGYLREFARAVRTVAPSVVHANSLYSFEEAAVSRLLRKRVVLHVHDMLPTSRKAGPARRIARRSADVTIAVSGACAASYAYGGWWPSLVYEAAPIPREPVVIRECPSPFVVGSVGVVSKRKGSDLFVEAARLASDQLGVGVAEFRMVGAPTDSLDSEWAARVLGMADDAGVHHQMSADVQREFESWDAFVLPSRRDPCPIALLEAMAAGLPCIGTDVDGISEQLADGAGILVPGDDESALAGAVVSLVNASHAERYRLGSAARRRVGERFSLDQQAIGLDRAYRDALGRR
jgi:glycosyltransferase involved in cell wall biosynthesis